MKLYKVSLRGMSSTTGTDYQVSYVAAEDPTAAENKVKDYLEEAKLGFRYDREVESIQLLAEDVSHPDCRCIFYP